MEIPGSSQPFSLDTEMNWTATAELVPRRHLVDKVSSLVVRRHRESCVCA